MEAQGYEVEAQNINVLGSSEEANHQAQGYEVEAQNSNVLGSSEEANHQAQGYEVEAQNSNVLGSSEEANQQSQNSNARADCGLPRPNSLPKNPSYSPPQSIQGSSPMHYDPTRIPPSIFAKSTTPAEWSVASNESLFSIHVGTQSFSVLKSGDLTMINEYSLPDPVSDSAPLPPLAPAVVDKPNTIPPSSLLVSQEPDNIDTNNNANTTERDSKTPEVQAQTTDNVHTSPSISCQSRDSHISTQSFVFPVLASRNASTRAGLEEEKQSHPQPQQMARQPSQEKTEPQKSAETETPNAAWCGLFSCFSCYRFC